jgi:hypothetical protein
MIMMHQMNHYENEIFVDAQRQQKMQEAEAWRLAQLAQNPSDERQETPVYGPLLARTGERLVELGQRLQERYSQPVALSIAAEGCIDCP